MNRCAISRADGIIRLAILCHACALEASRKLVAAQRKFWMMEYHGPNPCEACMIYERNALEQGETNG